MMYWLISLVGLQYPELDAAPKWLPSEIGPISLKSHQSTSRKVFRSIKSNALTILRTDCDGAHFSLIATQNRQIALREVYGDESCLEQAIVFTKPIQIARVATFGSPRSMVIRNLGIPSTQTSQYIKYEWSNRSRIKGFVWKQIFRLDASDKVWQIEIYRDSFPGCCNS